MADLTEKLKTLPDNPGVYIMFDEHGTIIYVGKAKVLKNRVRQYFHQSGNKTEKVLRMVEKIADFHYIITPSEKDAFSLESNLIKKHKPYYNILLKDDKSYPYIKVNLTESFPSFSVTRKVRRDKNKYFGPLMAGVRYKDILEILAICFKVRLCGMNLDKVPKSHRPCLNYHLGRCHAPCMGYIDREKYKESVQAAISFLQGSQEEAKQLLTEKMLAASNMQDFETALVYRDRINMLDLMREKVLSALGKDVDIDLFRYVSDDSYGALSLIIVRGGKIVASENHPITALHLTEAEVYAGFLLEYYKSGKLIPSEIVTGCEIDPELSGYLAQLAGYKVNLITAKQGMRGQLLDMAEKNAFDFLEKSRDSTKHREDMTEGAVKSLGEYLSIPPPRRMECYDISNISGTDKVSSMVVFLNGEAAKAHYRRFRIKTVEGSNDFASMKETLTRRLKHLENDAEDISFSSLPDLIVIDGGKGQLKYALEAMQECGVQTNIISLAKREEEVFLPGRELPVLLPRASVALKLLQRIRDEAHRFAITYHRSIRGSHMLVSKLDSIEGVGSKRRTALIRHFKSFSALAEATAEEIAKVDNIGPKLAEKIKLSLGEAAKQTKNTEEI